MNSPAHGPDLVKSLYSLPTSATRSDLLHYNRISKCRKSIDIGSKPVLFRHISKEITMMENHFYSDMKRICVDQLTILRLLYQASKKYFIGYTGWLTCSLNKISLSRCTGLVIWKILTQLDHYHSLMTCNAPALDALKCQRRNLTDQTTMRDPLGILSEII